MDKAASDEKRRKAAAAENRKRPLSAAADQPSDPKRAKLEAEAPASTSASAYVAAFDFTSLPATLITDLIVANLEAFSEPALLSLVQTYRESRGLNGPSSPTIPTPTTTAPAPHAPKIPTGPKRSHLTHLDHDQREIERTSTPTAPPEQPSAPPPPPVKDEPVDPLQMDIDQDELEYEPDKLNEEVCFLNLLLRKSYLSLVSYLGVLQPLKWMLVLLVLIPLQST